MSAVIRTLYVDDDPAVVRKTARSLEQEHDHIEVVTATSPKDALSRIGEEQIDCIVSPYNVPDTNGIEFFRRVRDEYPELPFVLIGDEGNGNLAMKAVSAGVSEYVPKGTVTDLYAVLTDRIETAVEQNRGEKLRERGQVHHQALFENTPDPILEVAFEGVTPLIEDANPAFEEAFGFERGAVIGRSVTDVLVPEGEREEHLSLRDTVVRGSTVQTEVSRRTADGIREFRLRIIPIHGADGSAGAYAWYTDITERKRYETRLEGLNEASQRLMTATSESTVAEITIEVLDDVLDEPLASMWSFDTDDDRLVPLAAADPDMGLEDKQAVADAIGPIPSDTAEMRAFQRGEVTIIEDYHELDEPSHPDASLGTLLIIPLGNYGQLHVGSRTVDTFDDRTRELIEVLGGMAETALKKVDRERVLSELHDTTRKLMQATSSEEIASITVETGRDILGLPHSHLYLLSDDGSTLGPAAATAEMRDRFGDLPTFNRDQGMLWDAFDTDETLLYDDVKEEGSLATDLPFHSAIITSVGDHGVFGSASLEPAEFGDFEQELASLLAAQTEAALDRADREQALREREEELEQQNKRLEKFASVLSHDLRNPLTVASGQLALASDRCDSEHISTAQSALSRMETMINEVLQLARAGKTIDEPTSVNLTSVVEECWQNVDTEHAELITENDLTVSADERKLKHVFENLFRNAVDHGSPSSPSQGRNDGEEYKEPYITIRVGELDDSDGFFIEDDGSGIPDSEHEKVFDFGFSTEKEGSGFGLSIVEEIVNAHGWEIDVTDGTTGGARFEITGVDSVS